MTLPTLTAEFVKLGLLGHPLGHSLSPVLHQRFLQQAGLSGTYDLYDCPPENLAHQTQILQQAGLTGWNVTIPYKQAILPYLNRLTPEAEALQAVNTVRQEPDGTLTGHNTDGLGFWQDLPPSVQQGIREHKVIVLGQGGSARAVLATLAHQGAKTITLVVRSREKAQPVADWLRARQPLLELTVVTFEERNTLAQAMKHAHLLVNTTPVGMWPHEDNCPLPPEVLAQLPGSAHGYDLIYKPRQTRLVSHLLRQGNTAQSGLGMLVHQAAAAFTFWTGQVVAPETIAALLNDPSL